MIARAHASPRSYGISIGSAVLQGVRLLGGSVAKRLAHWTQAQKGDSFRQTVHTHRASVHQAAKLVAALLKVVGVTAGLAESNGSLPPGL